MSTAAIVQSKALEALGQSGGQRGPAQRLLLQWAGRDRALLAALAAPYLAGLAARAIDRAAGGGRAAQPSQRALPADAFDRLVGALGERIGTSEEPSGMAALISPPQRRQAGEGHARTLRALAKAHAARRFDPPAGSGGP